jgi:hypothetical protein
VLAIFPGTTSFDEFVSGKSNILLKISTSQGTSSTKLKVAIKSSQKKKLYLKSSLTQD